MESGAFTHIRAVVLNKRRTRGDFLNLFNFAVLLLLHPVFRIILKKRNNTFKPVSNQMGSRIYLNPSHLPTVVSEGMVSIQK